VPHSTLRQAMIRVLAIILFSVLQMGLCKADDPFHFVYENSPGPVSIQIIWLDSDTGNAFLNKQIALKAALEVGTEKYIQEKFKSLSIDYRIEWEVQSEAGIHRLGVAFANLKKDLALDMLDQVLNHNSFAMAQLAAWKKSELYHYNYYRYDSDSLMKWWMTGKEAYYERLKDFDLENLKVKSLSELLGKAQLVSAVGLLPEAEIRNSLSNIIETQARKVGLAKPGQNDLIRPRDKSSSVLGATLATSGNPLLAAVYYEIVTGSVTLKQTRFQPHKTASLWTRNYLVDSSLNAKGFHDAVLVLNDEKLEQVKDMVLTKYLLWLEYNKNQALANAYVELGFWNDEMADQFANEMPSETREQIGRIKWTFYEWRAKP